MWSSDFFIPVENHDQTRVVYTSRKIEIYVKPGTEVTENFS